MAANRLFRFLSRIADVRPGEELISLLLFAYFFFITAAYTIIKSLRVFEYLEKQGSQKLPLAYFSTAVLTGLAMALYSKLQLKMKRHVLNSVSLIFFTFTCFLFWLVFRQNWDWLPLAYWIWASILIVVLVTQFWLQVNDIFNPREAKRLIGFFGSGGILGGIIGGELTGLFAKPENSSDFLLLSCLLLVGCLFFIHSIFIWERVKLTRVHKSEETIKEKEYEKSGAGFKACFDAVRQNRYLTLIAAAVALALVVSTLIDWQFNNTIEHSASLEKNLISFLGHFNAGLLVFSFLVQLFLTTRILKTFGVRLAILFYPAILLIFSTGLGLFPGVLFALLLKGSDKSLHYSLDQSVHKLLYIPVTPEVKHRAEMFIDMFLDRLAKSLGALILVVIFYFGLGVKSVSILAALLILTWIFLNLKISQEYAGTVKQKLKLKWGRADKAVAEKIDMDYTRLVFDTLESKNRSSVLYAMHLFDLIKQDKLTPEVKKLIAYESDEMKISSLGSLFEAEESSVLPETEEFLGEDVLKKEIGEIMSLDVYQEVMKKHISNVLASPSEDSLSSRLEVAKALGFMDAKSPLIHKLNELLLDKSTDVRRYAIESAARLKRREFVPSIIQSLKNLLTREDATSALAKYGQKIVGTLGDYMRDPEEEAEKRKAVASVLGKIPSQEAVDILLKELEEPESEIGAGIIEALDKIRSEMPRVRFSEKLVKNIILREIETYYRMLLKLHESASEAGEKRLDKGLIKSLDELLLNIFKLLGLIYSHEDMAKAFQNIKTGTKSSLDYAIELLDNALPREIKDKLFFLVEDIPLKEKLKRCRALLQPSSPPRRKKQSR